MKSLVILSVLFAQTALAKETVCQDLWKKHKSDYMAELSQIDSNELTTVHQALKSAELAHGDWLKNMASDLKKNQKLLANLELAQKETGILKQKFAQLKGQEKAYLFAGQKRFQDLKRSHSETELFERSLQEEYFGIRQNPTPEKLKAFKYISEVENMNWSTIQPLDKSLKAEVKAANQGRLEWKLENGLIQEVKVNHYRHSGEYVVSLCSRADESSVEALKNLPPQFACTRVNLLTGQLEKGFENMKEVEGPAQLQAYVTEKFLESKARDVSCQGYFIKASKVLKTAMR